MYLHIGNQKNIRKTRLIGIFDTDNATVSEITRGFLRKNERDGRVSSAVAEIPKSFVLYNGLSSESYGRSKSRRIRKGPEKRANICFSQLSSSSLSGRIEGKE